MPEFILIAAVLAVVLLGLIFFLVYKKKKLQKKGKIIHYKKLVRKILNFDQVNIIVP